MGMSCDVACVPCKVRRELGHGPYSTWNSGRTVVEHDANGLLDRRLVQAQRNQLVRQFLEEHEAHGGVEFIGWDWCSIVNGDLYSETGPMGASELWIIGWCTFEWSEPPAGWKPREPIAHGWRGFGGSGPCVVLNDAGEECGEPPMWHRTRAEEREHDPL
jgi:hypothetical protein